MKKFKIVSNYKPSGDQPGAINSLVNGIESGNHNQVLLGITGSGKTYTMANVIERTQKPSLIISHNKTLAAQIYAEMKEFFPDNAVEYFVSYYDYYQPEAYIPKTDTYIEKDVALNERIDLMRHSATRSLLERKDVIVVSSVSCIYGLGSPELYSKMTLYLELGKSYKLEYILSKLVDLQYERNDISFTRGTFRVKGDIIDVFPAHYSEKAWRLSFFGEELEYIGEFDPITGKKITELDSAVIYASSHYVTPHSTITKILPEIKSDLHDRLLYYNENNKLLEKQRLNERTNYDLEMLLETGMCKGIENYSRYLSGTKPGEPPPTLFSYLPKDSLLFIDESHVTVPQVRAMYHGDRARKTTLVEYGFRLPAALDNRPLKFEEWQSRRPQTVFVSATPSDFELDLTGGEVVEQIIRPTGLLDPECIIKPAEKQVEDLMHEIKKTTKLGYRTLVTVLTKKMAEELTEYLDENGHKVCYLHSEIKTLERIDIIKDLREGKVDVIVGINLLREGLDIPECALVAILDADKEGFLRSEVSLIQTIGRAARNACGRVVLYADKITKSIDKAVTITHNRRNIQKEHNKKHNITPLTVDKKTAELFNLEKIKNNKQDKELSKAYSSPKELEKYISKLKKEMLNAASELEFEKAAKIRDKIKIAESAQDIL